MEEKENKQPAFKQYYQVRGLYVFYDGKKVKREYPGTTYSWMKRTSWLSIKTDKEGNKYVHTKDRGNIRVDQMVATCYCHREPGQNYIIHKDKDKSNCHRFNLQWVTADEYRKFYLDELTYIDEETKEKWVWAEDNIYVSEQGNVRIDGIDQTVHKLVSDTDLGCCRAVMPYVRKNFTCRMFHVEDLVAAAFCPKLPDVANQVILHIDYDYTNNAASNLKWVEPSDEEYIKYKEQMKKDWEALNLENGPLP